MSSNKNLINKFTNIKLVKNIFMKFRNKFTILYYHGVAEDSYIKKLSGPNKHLFVPKSYFIEQMSFLKKNDIDVISIDDLYKSNFKPNKFSVILSFDDGYKDNLSYALPILEKFQIPVTIYITTRFPEGDTSMWWYEIWDYLKENKVLELNFLEKNKKWDITSFKQKLNCFSELGKWLLGLSSEFQKKALESITQTKKRKQYSNLVLNWDEIKLLDKHPLVSIGAHTHSHPNLKNLSEKEAFLEMKISKNILEEKLEHPISHFAYPFGSPKEADSQEFELARRCGFSEAVTTRPETIRNPDLYAIPRLGVPHYLTLNGFIGKLSGWECLIKKLKK